MCIIEFNMQKKEVTADYNDDGAYDLYPNWLIYMVSSESEGFYKHFFCAMFCILSYIISRFSFGLEKVYLA